MELAQLIFNYGFEIDIWVENRLPSDKPLHNWSQQQCQEHSNSRPSSIYRMHARQMETRGRMHLALLYIYEILWDDLRCHCAPLPITSCAETRLMWSYRRMISRGHESLSAASRMSYTVDILMGILVTIRFGWSKIRSTNHWSWTCLYGFSTTRISRLLHVLIWLAPKLLEVHRIVTDWESHAGACPVF